MGILPDQFGNGLLGSSISSWFLQNPQSIYSGNIDPSASPSNPAQAAACAQMLSTPTADVPSGSSQSSSGAPRPPLPPMLGGGQPSDLASVLNNNSNAILGYLAGALQGGNLGQSIGRGLQGWQQGQQTDMQRQTPAATYRALAAAGVPAATAQAAALNPEVMRALAPRYFQRLPTFGVIGQDELGRRRYGFIDPFNRSTQPVEGQTPASGPAR